MGRHEFWGVSGLVWIRWMHVVGKSDGRLPVHRLLEAEDEIDEEAKALDGRQGACWVRNALQMKGSWLGK